MTIHLGAVTVAFFALVAALWAWGWHRFLSELRRVAASLSHAVAVLEKPGEPGRMTVFPTRPIHLPRLWIQFLAERDRTTRKYQGQSLSTLAPEEFFFEDTLLPGYNRNFSVVMAGVFTALGILGTFVGLVLGLMDVNVGDESQLIQSVTQLLRGMNTAFLTSIFGIVASLLWLFSDRQLYNRVQKHTNQFLNAVRMKYPVEGADRLLHRLLEVEEGESAAIHEIRDLTTRQLEATKTQIAILQTLSFDLASAVADKFTAALAENLTPSLQALSQHMERLSVTFGEQQAEAMDQMVHSFQSSLTSEMKGQFEGLAQTLHDTAEWQTVVHKELGEVIEQMNGASNRQAEVLETQSEIQQGFRETAALVSQIAAEAAASVERVQAEVLETQSKIQEGFRETAALVSQITVEATASVERVQAAASEASQHLQSTLDLAKSHVDVLDSAAAGLVEKHRILEGSLELFTGANKELRVHLATQMDGMETQVRAMADFWNEFNGNLDGMGKQLAEGIQEFRATTEDRFREIFQVFDSEMAKVVSHLGGTLADMRETGEILGQGVLKLERALQEGTSTFSEATTSLASLPLLEPPLRAVSSGFERYRDLPDFLRKGSGELESIRKSMDLILSRLDAKTLTPLPEATEKTAAVPQESESSAAVPEATETTAAVPQDAASLDS